MEPDLTRPLCVIVGPTASGKTALSLSIARVFPSEIVNCDSVAVYREFEVGTAKPSKEQRAQAPHHLIDIVDPDETFTAGDYSRRARATIHEISERGHLPIVVGGTGLYLRALLDGLFAGPGRSEHLRSRLRAAEDRRGPGYLHRLLQRLDSQAAANIHASDVAKIIRAIEVCVRSGQKLTTLWQAGADPLRGYHIFKLGLDPARPALYERINARVREMIEQGLLGETRRLRERWGDDVRAMQALGYRQALQHLRGELSSEQLTAAIQQGHRNYAKRQLTWFRREEDIHWLQGFGDDADVQTRAIDLLRRSSAECGR